MLDALLVLLAVMFPPTQTGADPVRISPPYLFGEDPPHPVDLISSTGYPVQSHSVVTDDGYILAVFRIPGPPLKEPGNSSTTPPPSPPREPFILQHGLGMSAANWVHFGPEKSIAYYLVDRGFDVWISNVRGAKYSRKHKSLSPDSLKFWDFSWHEHGTLDMPAIIDYVRNETGYQRVWYAGHSMGTTMMFVMLSMRPEYNARIQHFFALAPIAYMARMRSLMRRLTEKAIRNTIKMTMDALGMNRIAFDEGALATVRNIVCAVLSELCHMTVEQVVGRDREQEFKGSYEISSAYFPMDVSVKQLMHYAQVTDVPNRFNLYDFEKAAKNKAVYGSETPPPYNMSKVTVGMTWLYGMNDYLGVPEDVEEFAQVFGHNPPKMHKIPLESFQHLDFLVARDMIQYVAEPMLHYSKEWRGRYGPIPTYIPTPAKAGAGKNPTSNQIVVVSNRMLYPVAAGNQSKRIYPFPKTNSTSSSHQFKVRITNAQ